MLKFLKSTFAILVFVPVILVLPLFFFEVDGTTDAYYLRLATPAQSSLVLGTSRAAQGINPQVLNEVLDKNIFNYAFTLGHSPYGPTYLKSIQKKLNTQQKDNIFILTVDPWNISANVDAPNNVSKFIENKRILATTPFVNSNPNYWYIFNNFQGNLDKIIHNPSALLLHENGWLEIDVKMDTTSVAQRLQSKLDIYENENLPRYAFSTVRFDYLKKTIDYLNQFGKVYLVRLPVHQKILAIEDRFMPDFNEKIKEIKPLTRGYLDMTPNHQKYQYTDGNHLYKDSGNEVTREIAEWIKNN